MGTHNYDVLIVTAEQDFLRLQMLYHRLQRWLPESRRIVFLAPYTVGEHLKRLNWDWAHFLNEEEILPFASVHRYMSERLAGILKGTELPRGVTAWYYQQFLKMQYALICEDEYYMVWDGDTIPCRAVKMFQEQTGTPYFDVKQELHEGYFDTIEKLFAGMNKVIKGSFISEHMLIKTVIMKEMLEEIGNNQQLKGNAFWEKILYAIPTERIQEADFSEFETYGTYTAMRHTSEYRLREWHSFRLGAEFFEVDTISDSDFEWLGKDFDAISFEKNQFVREDHRNLFNNPQYQQKMSARQMLQAVQQEFKGGYVETWT